MCYSVEITDKIGNYVIAPLIENITIEKSIKNLSDTATITASIFNMNNHFIFKENIADDGKPENKLYKIYKRGQKIKIYLGYDDNLKLEFSGYVREVKTNNDILTLECEDELFIFRGKTLPDKTIQPATVKQIAKHVCSHFNKNIKVVCDYDMGYEKFTIYKATGLDVLKQIQEDTGADIYFKSSDTDEIGKNTNSFNLILEKNAEKPEKPVKETLELHIRMPYMKKEIEKAETDFSFQHNIESGSLEYVDTTDKKVKVKITTVSTKGITETVEYGNTGGDEFEYKVNRINNSEMKKRAKIEFEKLMRPGYTGSFTAWLIPYVEPNYSIGIYDKDFPEKDGIYNIESVKTDFSSTGGIRTITPGIKLSKNETDTNILPGKIKRN